MKSCENCRHYSLLSEEQRSGVQLLGKIYRKKGRNKNDGRGKGTGFQVRRAARLQESAG